MGQRASSQAAEAVVVAEPKRLPKWSDDEAWSEEVVDERPLDWQPEPEQLVGAHGLALPPALLRALLLPWLERNDLLRLRLVSRAVCVLMTEYLAARYKRIFSHLRLRDPQYFTAWRGVSLRGPVPQHLPPTFAQRLEVVEVKNNVAPDLNGPEVVMTWLALAQQAPTLRKITFSCGYPVPGNLTTPMVKRIVKMPMAAALTKLKLGTVDGECAKVLTLAPFVSLRSLGIKSERRVDTSAVLRSLASADVRKLALWHVTVNEAARKVRCGWGRGHEPSLHCSTLSSARRIW